MGNPLRRAHYRRLMTRLAANISTMFHEHDFPTRVDAAAACGFRALECQFPYDTPAAELKARLEATGLELVLLNAPPGDFAAGDRGLASVDGREDDYRTSIETALTYADQVGCPHIHVMAGCPTDGEATRRFIDRVGWAADHVADAGVDILIEPMSRRDVPGYLLSGSRQAERVIEQVGRANVKLQFDTYHLQVNEGDLVQSFERCLPVVGHVQMSSNPGRHEVDQGELDHRWLLGEFDRLGYDGWIGCEYRPRAGTVEGLGWAQPHGITPTAI